MKLSFEAVKNITFGSIRSFEDADGMHFAKCTEKQVAAWKEFSDFLGTGAAATTGVRLDFHTNSKRFAFKPSSGRRFELYVNGTFREVFLRNDEDDVEFSFVINEPTEESRITLYFPSHDVPGVLSYVELDDGATLCPHKFDMKFFFIGDSITQGWNSHYDSLSYANRVSDFFNAESVIQGVGGAFFHENIFDPSIDFDPDVALVAFGTNDWGRFESIDELIEHTSKFLDAFADRFAGKKLFGISPIWRGNPSDEIRKTGYFKDVCEAVKNQIKAHGITLIEGEYLTPHMPDFYSDQYLHPNGLGFGIYAENLCKALKDQI
jgi:hypothetical protein